MSTRSVVYANTEKGIQGVYVHSDGYPEWALPTLHALIAREGTAKTVATLLGRPSGWSHLETNQTEEMHSMYQDGRFEAVPGFGVQYTDVDNQGETEYRGITNRGWDIEYVYVFGPDDTILWAPDTHESWDDLNWQTSEPARVTAQSPAVAQGL
jgi:hypothetical protein